MQPVLPCKFDMLLNGPMIMSDCLCRGCAANQLVCDRHVFPRAYALIQEEIPPCPPTAKTEPRTDPKAAGERRQSTRLRTPVKQASVAETAVAPHQESRSEAGYYACIFPGCAKVAKGLSAMARHHHTHYPSARGKGSKVFSKSEHPFTPITRVTPTQTQP